MLSALATALLKEESLDEKEILEVTGLTPAPARPGETLPAQAAAMSDLSL